MWACASNSALASARVAQSCALKVILGRPRRYPTVDLLSEAGVEPFLELVRRLVVAYRVDGHRNPLVRRTGDFRAHCVPYRIRVHFPLEFRDRVPPRPP